MPEIDELSMHIYMMNMLHYFDIMYDIGELSKEEYTNHMNKIMTIYQNAMSRISEAKAKNMKRSSLDDLMNSKGGFYNANQ